MVADQMRMEQLEEELAVVKEETAAALNAALQDAEDHSAALLADIARLQAELAAAQQERDEAKVAVDAFRAKMESWKGKVRTVVEDRERERDALQSEAMGLRREVAAAKQRAEAAVREAADAAQKADAMHALLVAEQQKAEALSKLNAASSEEKVCVPEAAQDAAPPVSATASASAVDEAPQPPALPLPPDAREWQTVLSECERLTGENDKLRRAVAELLRFKRSVMEEIRSVGAVVRRHE
ncbi:hypothetical protein ABB37_09306 [Leptomonas pyrrhocoris]|uniref:Uncharacterized protein n=1 Tax=Leptomonas pyrrhocoris TaxID=157538 RepID=A0A0M9FRD5_LEPPY|nr:hypothetical protein ABB37_09306 [Leptomonas pyrrhocoris]KPA74316.1 hypothetical protein ABB37_09306 [Leptomonas pyrrhocoris]|eukprot:XP_015652755.1 hypothetical protein ABB37_09306 [Leptomonas pyrrhocoris]